MASIQLISSILTAPTVVRVLCSGLTVAGAKKNTAEPNVSGSNIVEVHTQGFENPKYTLNNVIFDPDTTLNILTLGNIYEMYKHKYDGTNKIYLRVLYDSATPLVASDSTTTDIPVILDSYNLNLNVEDTKNARKPVATLVFRETQ